MKKACRLVWYLYQIILYLILNESTAFAQATSISGTINIYTPVIGMDTVSCPAAVTVSSTAGFTVGNKVLIIQMKGAVCDTSNTTAFGNVLTINGAGNYEICQITAIVNNTVFLNGKFSRVFNLSGLIQMVRIPTYANAQVTSVVSCPAWNGSTGGIIILECTGNLQLSAGINAVGKGFRGGTISNNPDGGCGTGSLGYFYPLVQSGFWSTGGAQKGEGIAVVSASRQAGRGPQVNGGGGGNKHNTGGGGGSNYTLGGKGGNELSGCTINGTGGLGGVSLANYYTNRLFMGGGGGSGDQNNSVGTSGENGGGIIIIIAGSISGNGNLITASGSSVTGMAGAAADGAGGGGAGGSIFIQTSLVGSSFSIHANGGNGGSQNPGGYCAGPGGGGGTGAILTNQGALTAVPSLTPGAAGIVIAGPCINTTYGAMPGITTTVGIIGGASLNYMLPAIGPLFLGYNSTHSVLCSGNTATITVVGAASYTWQPGGIISNTIAVAPFSNSTYTVIGQSSAGCTNSITVSQSVNPSPNLLIAQSNLSVCPLAAAGFTATGASNYTWMPGGSNNPVLSVFPAANTIYTVTGETNGCESTAMATQYIYNLPTVAATPSVSVCTGSLFTLNVSGASSYTWSPGNTGASFSSTLSSSQIFTVTGSSANGCTATATSSVYIRPVPSLAFSTFSITCASLGSATVIASGGVGPFSYSWAPTGQSGSVAINLFPSVYTLNVMDNGTGCLYIRTTTFTPLVPLSGTVVAQPSLNCNGVNNATASIILAAGSGTQTYQWTDINGLQSSSVAIGLAAGINTVYVIDALTFCSVTHTFLITQPPALTLNVSAASFSSCLGNSINYTAQSSGGVGAFTYTWFPNNISQLHTVAENSAGNYIYTVQSADANSCIATRSVLGLFVPNPTITVANPTVCPLQPTLIVASGASTYTWNTGSTINPLNVMQTLNTVFTVTGSAQSCTATGSGTVFIKPAPSVTVSSNSPVCENDTLRLSGTNAMNTLWQGPVNFTSAVLNPKFKTTTLAQSGIYSLKITAANACTAIASISVTVNQIPLLSAAAGTVCSGSMLPLSASYVAGGIYSWTGNNFSANQMTTAITSASLINSGIYSVQVTSPAGCTNQATAQASVVAQSIIIISGDTTICRGSALTLCVAGQAGFQWNGPSFFTVNPCFTIQPVQMIHAGMYTLTAVNGPCTQKFYKSVIVYQLPNVQVSTLSPVCEGDQVNITATGASTYSWIGPGNYNNTGPQIIFPAQNSSAGNYTVTGADGNTCANSNTISLIVLPAPVIGINDYTVCAGGDVTLSVTGGVQWTWTGPGSFQSGIQSPVINNVLLNNAGFYSVLVTGTNTCSKSATLQLSIFNFTLPTVQIDQDRKLCRKSTATISASGGSSYTWFGGGKTYSGSVVYLSAGDSLGQTIYTLTVKNENNCVSTNTIAVPIFDLPVVELKPVSDLLCAPFCTDLLILPASVAKQGLKWEVKAGVAGDKLSELKYCVDKPGNYPLSLMVTDTNGCQGISTITLSAFETPVADFVFSPVDPIAGQDEVLFYNTSSGLRISDYLWQIAGVKIDSLYNKNESYLFTYAGTFPIVMIATNVWGCADTVVKVIHVLDQFGFFIPNAFSPNEDDVNDIFLPKGSGIREYHLYVFDRWGKQIFYSSDPGQGWDGTFKNSPCKPDVYTYKVNLKDDSGELHSYVGRISLLR